MAAVDLWYETHAITTDNERGIATGWLPGELSERGRALAPAIGERCRARGVEIVYASDLARAVETARLAFGSAYRLDPRLRECDYGELNGAPVARIERERRRRIDVPFPGGQSYRDVVAQMASFLRELAAGDATSVAVIGHSATRWALEHLLTGADLEDLVSAPFGWQEGWRYELPLSSRAMASRRVAIIEDHGALRVFLRDVLTRMDWEVTGTAGTADAAYELVVSSSPDVAVVDLYLASAGGGDALVRRLAAAGTNTRLLVFTATSDPKELRDVLEAGADGIVLKEGGLPELLAGLDAVTKGERYVSPSLPAQP